MADDGRLHIVKLDRARQRQLVVDVFDTDGDRVVSIDLPNNVDHAVIENLDPHSTYRIGVRRRHLLERYRHPQRWYIACPRTRDLRVLITGSGRCGTQTLAKYLDAQHFDDGTPVVARHEPLAEWMLDAFIAGDRTFPTLQQRGALHNVESAPYYSIYPDAICARTVVLVIRDGRRVVQSGLNRGWFTRDSPWDYIKPNYGLDQFGSCCRLWVDCNLNGASRADHIFRLEDLVLDRDHLRKFGAALGLDTIDAALPHSNRSVRLAGSADTWSAENRATFDSICGDLMDHYYPTWRDAG